MLDVLHWLPIHLRIAYRIDALVWRCLLGLAPAYLRELCCPTSGALGRRSLGSAEMGALLVPFERTSTMQNRAFSVVGSLLWNGLPLALRLLPKVHSDLFYSGLKTALFSRAGVGSTSK